MELAGGCWQIPGFAQNNPISDLNDIYREDSRQAAAGHEGKVWHRDVLYTFFGKNAVFAEMLQKIAHTRRSPETMIEIISKELDDRLQGNEERGLDAVLLDHEHRSNSRSCDESDFNVDACYAAMCDYGGEPLYASCGGATAVKEAVRVFGQLKRDLQALKPEHWANHCHPLFSLCHGDLNAANIMVDLHTNCWSVILWSFLEFLYIMLCVPNLHPHTHVSTHARHITRTQGH